MKKKKNVQKESTWRASYKMKKEQDEKRDYKG